MKLRVVTMIKNEADILPVFLSHISRFFDGGHLIDHCSTDGSTQLLEAFCARHSGWNYIRLDFTGYFQSEVTKFFLHEQFKGDADAVVLLDADEFVAGSRGDLDRQLATLAPDQTGLLQWRNCIPDSFDCGVQPDAPLWVSRTPSQFGKLIITRALHERVAPDFSLFPGSHWIAYADGVRVPSRTLGVLYHLPLRSTQHATIKAVTKVLAYIARGVTDRDAGTHNFELVDLAAAGQLTDATLVAFVNAYGLRAELRRPVSRQEAFSIEELSIELADGRKPIMGAGAKKTEPDRLLCQVVAVLAGWGLATPLPEFLRDRRPVATAQPPHSGLVPEANIDKA